MMVPCFEYLRFKLGESDGDSGKRSQVARTETERVATAGQKRRRMHPQR